MSLVLEMMRNRRMITAHTDRMLQDFMLAWNVSDFDAVIDTHLLSEQEIADLLSKELKLDRLYMISPDMVDESVVRLVPFEKAREKRLLPLRKVGKKIEVAMANPTDVESIQWLEEILNTEIAPVVVELRDVLNMVHECYPLDAQIPSLEAR